MPELPEVETIARDLEGTVKGVTITSVHVFRKDVLREVAAPTFVKRLTGATITRWWRRAKYAIADISTGDRVVVSPKFTGALLVEPATWNLEPSDYTVIAFALRDGRTLRYRDVRRLGTVALMAPKRFDAWIAKIGPEPFDPALTAELFAGAVRASKRAIKTILMDQHKIAGIGNIYANEALWRARIRPSRRGSTITRAEAALLLKESQDVLRAAVEQRGTSFRDYQDPQGGRGGFLGLAKVYSREGEPCVRCGTILKHTHKLEGRITVWCSRCQR